MSPRTLSASKAPQPPSFDSMPSVHATPRSRPRRARASARPAAERARPRRCRPRRGTSRCRTRTPSRRRELRPPHGPVAAVCDLLAEQPAGGSRQRLVVGRQPGVGERRDGEARVPDGRLARLDPAHRRPRARCSGRSRRAPSQGRIVESVAEEVQRDERVDPRRLDPAPAAVRLLALEDPALDAAQRGAPERLDRRPLVHVEQLVERDEERPGRVGLARRSCPPVRSSSRSNGSGCTGRKCETTVSATTVWRAQQAKS